MQRIFGIVLAGVMNVVIGQYSAAIPGECTNNIAKWNNPRTEDCRTGRPGTPSNVCAVVTHMMECFSQIAKEECGEKGEKYIRYLAQEQLPVYNCSVPDPINFASGDYLIPDECTTNIANWTNPRTVNCQKPTKATSNDICAMLRAMMECLAQVAKEECGDQGEKYIRWLAEQQLPVYNCSASQTSGDSLIPDECTHNIANWNNSRTVECQMPTLETSNDICAAMKAMMDCLAQIANEECGENGKKYIQHLAQQQLPAYNCSSATDAIHIRSEEYLIPDECTSNVSNWRNPRTNECQTLVPGSATGNDQCVMFKAMLNCLERIAREECGEKGEKYLQWLGKQQLPVYC